MYWTQIQVKLSVHSFKDPEDQSCVLAVLFKQIHFEVNAENPSDCQSQIVQVEAAVQPVDQSHIPSPAQTNVPFNLCE